MQREGAFQTVSQYAALHHAHRYRRNLDLQRDRDGQESVDARV
jgi:hypothetical protein